MALYSNWNVLTLPIKADGKYKIGDTYHVLDEEYPKFLEVRWIGDTKY